MSDGAIGSWDSVARKNLTWSVSTRNSRRNDRWVRLSRGRKSPGDHGADADPKKGRGTPDAPSAQYSFDPSCWDPTGLTDCWTLRWPYQDVFQAFLDNLNMSSVLHQETAPVGQKISHAFPLF